MSSKTIAGREDIPEKNLLTVSQRCTSVDAWMEISDTPRNLTSGHGDEILELSLYEEVKRFAEWVNPSHINVELESALYNK